MAPQSPTVAQQSRAFRLTFKGPLHVGEAGVGIEESLAYLPSDTLFSALVVTWLEMGRQDLVDQLGVRYANEPPLLVSSAMPFAGELRFFPKPLLHTPMEEAQKEKRAPDVTGVAQQRSGKSFRRVQWVSQKILAELIAGIAPTSLHELWQSSATIQDGAIWLTEDECAAVRQILHTPVRLSNEAVRLWHSGQNPKVAIDRISRASNLYSVGSTRFAKECGLWMVARGEPEWLEATQAALRLLQDSGIGGRRSRGNGAFVLSPCDGWQDLPSQAGGYQMLLSRLAPRQEDFDLLLNSASSYQLVRVGGWNGTPGDRPFLRKAVRMLAEGSVIGATASGERVPGRLVDVNVEHPAIAVNHPIYRYGLGLGIGARPHA